MTTETKQADLPWHAAFPSPQTDPASLSREDLLQWIREGKQPGKDFLLVDLRRTDFEGGTIRGSLNLPAQSLHPTLPTLYALVASGTVKYVIFYCGSSGGRGTRAAGWFADFLREKSDTAIKSVKLEGGIKGWAAAGEEYTQLMDGYEASAWKK